MPDSMWPLRWFRYDGGIDSPEVYLLDGDSEAELMSRDEALAIARSRGLHLVPEWPEHLTTGPAWCRIGMVSLPFRWEHRTVARLPGTRQVNHPQNEEYYSNCG